MSDYNRDAESEARYTEEDVREQEFRVRWEGVTDADTAE